MLLRLTALAPPSAGEQRKMPIPPAKPALIIPLGFLFFFSSWENIVFEG
jgi:hypothetical protein